MSLPAVVAVLMVARVAAADRAIAVEVTDTPFAAAELESAIRVRSGDGGPLRLRVIGLDHGRAVRIESVRGDREIELGDARGAAAARLVALVASDLWLDDLAAPPARSHREPWQLGAVIGVAGWSGTLGTAGIELEIPHGGWLIACELAGGQLLDDKIGLDGGVVRLSAGARFDWFELRAGAVAIPVFVSSGVGDQTVLVGAGASARATAALGGGFHAIGSAGVDVFATRTEYRVLGRSAFVTPRWAPWFTAGIGVDL